MRRRWLRCPIGKGFGLRLDKRAADCSFHYPSPLRLVRDVGGSPPSFGKFPFRFTIPGKGLLDAQQFVQAMSATIRWNLHKATWLGCEKAGTMIGRWYLRCCSLANHRRRLTTVVTFLMKAILGGLFHQVLIRRSLSRGTFQPCPRNPHRPHDLHLPGFMCSHGQSLQRPFILGQSNMAFLSGKHKQSPYSFMKEWLRCDMPNALWDDRHNPPTPVISPTCVPQANPLLLASRSAACLRVSALDRLYVSFSKAETSGTSPRTQICHWRNYLQISSGKARTSPLRRTRLILQFVPRAQRGIVMGEVCPSASFCLFPGMIASRRADPRFFEPHRGYWVTSIICMLVLHCLKESAGAAGPTAGRLLLRISDRREAGLPGPGGSGSQLSARFHWTCLSDEAVWAALPQNASRRKFVCRGTHVGVIQLLFSHSKLPFRGKISLGAEQWRKSIETENFSKLILRSNNQTAPSSTDRAGVLGYESRLTVTALNSLNHNPLAHNLFLICSCFLPCPLRILSPQVGKHASLGFDLSCNSFIGRFVALVHKSMNVRHTSSDLCATFFFLLTSLSTPTRHTNKKAALVFLITLGSTLVD
ncbi:hypothetical protein VP01_237g2 [Puccinia sorghi]|uniref:Uncharacterized protein n=1 Tax=Puccinia sorghi TaxID=27349 RepID=A0A0L6V8U3_9BASI|nr:hypothetical protein VP01_237g2 [Puccinia sorghi]